MSNTNVSKALQQARVSGNLKLQSRGLRALPAQCCDIGSVQLPEGSAWWETRETIETMDISQNELTSLPEAVGDLEDLRELDATHNKLWALPAVLAELPSLKKLMLGHNELGELPELGAFNLPPLVQLNASHNALSAVPASVAGLVELVELDLSHNRLSTLPAGIGGMRALQRLLLAKNGIVELPTDFVYSPPPLVSLDASENRLCVLQLSVPSLRTLLLANNRIELLEVHGCISLQELSAPYNAFVKLPAGLPSLPQLATVDLGSNKLADVAVLSGCASLTRLDLSCNEIREVPPLLGNLALNKLTLAGNPLRTMPSAVLNGPTPKLLAHLRGKIVDASPQWEGDVRGEMQHLDIDRSMASIGIENRPAQQMQGSGSARCAPQNGGGAFAGSASPHCAPPPQSGGVPPPYGGATPYGESSPYGQHSGRGPSAGYRPPPPGFGYGGGGGHDDGGHGGGCYGGGSGAGGGFEQVAPPQRGPPGFNSLYNRPPSQPSSARGTASPFGSARGPPAKQQQQYQHQPYQHQQPYQHHQHQHQHHQHQHQHQQYPPPPQQQRPPPPQQQQQPPLPRSVSASAPYMTSTNSTAAPAASSLDGLYSYVLKEGTELAVSNLKLAQLPSDGYPETLLTINASTNLLTSLPDGLPDTCPTLRCLDVSKNALSLLPLDLWQLPDLQAVRAGFNQLRDLRFVQRAMPSLTELNADRNGLGEVPPALWVCPRLKTVSLCQNRLTAGSMHMPGRGGGAVAPLEYLDLGENKLGALPPLALYPQLRKVHVQNNGIRELPVEHLMPLQKLQTLDVSCNDVSQLPPQLALLPVLQNLTIVGNAIRSIPQNVQQRGATAVLDLLRKRLPQ